MLIVVIKKYTWFSLKSIQFITVLLLLPCIIFRYEWFLSSSMRWIWFEFGRRIWISRNLTSLSFLTTFGWSMDNLNPNDWLILKSIKYSDHDYDYIQINVSMGIIIQSKICWLCLWANVKHAWLSLKSIQYITVLLLLPCIWMVSIILNEMNMIWITFFFYNIWVING